LSHTHGIALIEKYAHSRLAFAKSGLFHSGIVKQSSKQYLFVNSYELSQEQSFPSEETDKRNEFFMDLSE
jgi:hypothetical protein